MVDVRTLAEKILAHLHEDEQKRSHLHITIAAFYKAFEKEASYDEVQRAIGFLVDRDLIAPFSYSLTAKGRRDINLRRKNHRETSISAH
jgi:hypothetical protein